MAPGKLQARAYAHRLTTAALNTADDALVMRPLVARTVYQQLERPLTMRAGDQFCGLIWDQVRETIDV